MNGWVIRLGADAVGYTTNNIQVPLAGELVTVLHDPELECGGWFVGLSSVGIVRFWPVIAEVVAE